MPAAWTEKFRKLGRLQAVTAGALILYFLLAWLAPERAITVIAELVLVVCVFWLAIRAIRAGIRHALWGLRNRLLVTYLFIAVVPVLLIGSLALLAGWGLASQLSVYLATSELDRRITSLRFANEQLAKEPPNSWKAAMQGMSDSFFSKQFPGIHFLARKGNMTVRWPENTTQSPPAGWPDTSGIVSIDGQPFLWANTIRGDAALTVYAPLTRRFLSQMVPGILVSPAGADVIGEGEKSKPGGITVIRLRGSTYRISERPGDDTGGGSLSPPVNRFDVELNWFAQLPISVWEKPAEKSILFLGIRTRPSVLMGIVSSQKLGELNGIVPYLIAGFAVLFLVVELIALVIGISLTRTITHAVHALYQGTQKVIEGNFSHRIRVLRNDQLGELTTSFNVMTGQVERLLAIAKEKERMQTELEIAREVQNQLYPRVVPSVKGLRLTASVKPARMVSGDYYDYLTLDPSRVALSIGDVAGKGISAAILMATLQSSIRAHLRSTAEAAAVVGGAPKTQLSTAHFVSELNQHLYAFTTPEKYSTFCFGIYDDDTSLFTYTNAGHLPPILIREATARPLEVNGMVVGAFPFAKFEESSIELRTGDLLLCYTDGITEPENAYGEMFGEERLIELVTKNAASDEAKIIEIVMGAVQEWAGAVEQFDDMTILLARRT